MKKIFYHNYNVGSAIEQAGDIFFDWLKELKNIDIFVQKLQDQPSDIIKILVREKPDIIIINEYLNFSTESSYYYKELNPYTKIIHIEHIWKRFICYDGNDDHQMKSAYFRRNFYDSVDEIFCLNQMSFACYPKVKNYYYPTNPEIFNVIVPWGNRKNKFLYLGNLLPHKMSNEFIDKISKTDIIIDCYGRTFDEDEKEYTSKIRNCKNFNIIGLVPFSEVPKIMNNYKFFIMPHDGYEPFNWTMLQCMFCGTIPLVVNDKNSSKFDPSWIDWAYGLHFSTNTVEEMINNIKQLNINDLEFKKYSEIISSTAQQKFDYYKFKKDFQETVKLYL